MNAEDEQIKSNSRCHYQRQAELCGRFWSVCLAVGDEHVKAHTGGATKAKSVDIDCCRAL